MTPYLADADCVLYHGDALAVLRELPSESVHCIATSPPFYALRDYGTGRWEGGDEGCDHDAYRRRRDAEANPGSGSGAGGKTSLRDGRPAQECKCGATRIDQQIGLEKSPEEWAQRLVEVFHEARRVLRKDGTLWVECGDSYNAGTSTSRAGSTLEGSHGYWQSPHIKRRIGVAGGIKTKDLLGTPWLLAFALRADGWWLRGCNIWAKPNAMPESAKDRCTTAHSYVFHFARSARYFFDGDAISESMAPGSASRYAYAFGGGKAEELKEADRNGMGVRTRPIGMRENHGARAPRSVWNIPTQGFPEAHFATWPEALARRIILAGCPEQVCSVCGKARERIVGEREVRAPVERQGNKPIRYLASAEAGQGQTDLSHSTLGMVGHSPTLGFTDCACLLSEVARETHGCERGDQNGPRGATSESKYVPGTVLDPFAGSGTTLYVARKLGRRGIGIDLSLPYLEMAARRLQQQSLFAEAQC